MANEFIIKHGFLSKGNSEVTGSLKVTEGISGSFSGSFQGDGSDLNLANNTTIPTSSPFPLNGNAQITGSLIVSSSFADFSGLTDIKTRRFAITSDHVSGQTVTSASFYDSFVEALDASTDGDTLHVFSNDSSSITNDIFEGKNITIVGNGFHFDIVGTGTNNHRWTFTSCSIDVYDFEFRRTPASNLSNFDTSVWEIKGPSNWHFYNAGFAATKNAHALMIEGNNINIDGVYARLTDSTSYLTYAIYKDTTTNDFTLENFDIHSEAGGIFAQGDRVKIENGNIDYSTTIDRSNAITITGHTGSISNVNILGNDDNNQNVALKIDPTTSATNKGITFIENVNIRSGEITVQNDAHVIIGDCKVFNIQQRSNNVYFAGSGSITNCNIEYDERMGGYTSGGAGIQLHTDQEVRISNCHVYGFQFGLENQYPENIITVYDSYFETGLSYSGNGRGIYGLDTKKATIIGCQGVINESNGQGYGLDLQTTGSGKIHIANSDFINKGPASSYGRCFRLIGSHGNNEIYVSDVNIIVDTQNNNNGTSTALDISGVTGSYFNNLYVEGYGAGTFNAISSSIVNSTFYQKHLSPGATTTVWTLNAAGNDNLYSNCTFEVDPEYNAYTADPIVTVYNTQRFHNSTFKGGKKSNFALTGSGDANVELVGNRYINILTGITASNVTNITTGYIDGKGNWEKTQTTSSFDHIEATSLKIEGVVSASKFTANSGSLVGDLSISKTTGTGAPGTGTTHSIAVTVNDPDGGGNKYYLDSVLTGSVVMNQGDAYKFDQSDSSNGNGGGHPFRFSTGVNGSGTAPYEVGVTVAGTPGSAGAYTLISITAATTAPLYYYCTNHSGMGGGVLSIDSGSLNPMAGFANITGSTNLTGSLNLADNTKLKLGNSGDLEIYHDGSNSYIDEVGTGALFYRGGTQTFQNATGTKTMLTLNAASSVDLRFNNSTKLSTTNTGISVSNEITASGAISSSGIISMATASIGGGLFTSASLAAGGGGGGGGSAFPFAGDGVISGSLLISSSNVSGVSTASMTLQGSGSTIFDIQGSQGQLFSVTDDLIHDVFNVSDISGDTLLKVSGSGLIEIPVGPISSSGLLFISASENAGQSTYKTLVQDPATGRIYHTGSYGTGGGGGGSGDTYDLNATQDGDNVDLNLTSGTGTDNSVVQLTAGSNITLTRNSATEVTIASSGGGGSSIDTGSLKDTAITGSLIVTGSVVNFASASSVLLPAETVPLINPKVEYLTISEITASGTTVPLPNSLTFISSSTFEYLEIFINGLRLRYDIDFAPMSTSTVKYLTTIPSGSEVTYKSLRR